MLYKENGLQPRPIGHGVQQEAPPSSPQGQPGEAEIQARVSTSEGLPVLIEMNRKNGIDFAYLDLVEQLGVGCSCWRASKQR
jgi:hypothetical protein